MSAILAIDQNIAPLVHSEPLLSAKDRAYRKWFIDHEAANDALDLDDKCTQGQPMHVHYQKVGVPQKIIYMMCMAGRLLALFISVPTKK